MAHKNIAWYEFRLRPEHKEKRVGESQTVPDETLTIQEIMKKHVRGQRIADELMRTPVYDSGLSDYGDSESDFAMEDLSKVEGLDIAEKDEIRESYKQKIEDYKEKEKSFLKKKKEEESTQRQGKPRPTTEEPDPVPEKAKKPTKEAPTTPPEPE